MSDPARIAVVDDDLSVRRALPRLLRSAGHETRTFASAQELFDSGFATVADCLVLDIHLERFSGFELLEKVREAGSEAPAIFITAYADDASRERARSLGASAYLRKPFDGSALLDAISSALEVAGRAASRPTPGMGGDGSSRKPTG